MGRVRRGATYTAHLVMDLVLAGDPENLDSHIKSYSKIDIDLDQLRLPLPGQPKAANALDDSAEAID